MVTIIVQKGKPLKGQEVFYVAVPGQGIDEKMGKSVKPQNFTITPGIIDGTSVKSLPKFRFEGQLETMNCCITNPFDGYIMCIESELIIKSIEVQLVRVETFEGVTTATEVQNI